MIQEKAIRCISVNSDKVRYIIPRLANDDNFLKEIGFMRQELDMPTIEVEEIEKPVLETTSTVTGFEGEFKTEGHFETEPTKESKPKKAKRK